jgi:hypothetical protein
MDQKVESMVSCTSRTVENNRGGFVSVAASTLKSVQGTKRRSKEISVHVISVPSAEEHVCSTGEHVISVSSTEERVARSTDEHV